jgi:Putative zinc-finger
MNKMGHDISEREWLEYVSGTLEPANTRRIQSHLDSCPECARLLDDLSNWHDLLTTEGARLRQSLQLPPEKMEAFVGQAVERICTAPHPGFAGAHSRTAAEGLFLLRSLLEPIFGRGTARVAMDLAARRCTLHPDGTLRGADWPLFVRNLSETLASVCGSAAGRLVNRAGNSLVAIGA